ncbi:leucine-rich PPR motif-containing protein, mitochondrial [Gastrophryne carolinensis]
MAALLAGARLVLRQGARFLPVRTPPLPAARCLSRPARFLTTAVKEKGAIDVEHLPLADVARWQSNGWSLHHMGTKLKTSGRISKHRLLRTFEEVCKAGKPSGGQAWFLLQTCGSSMPEVPLAERTEMANTMWSKLQEIGVVFNESHYNTLLKIYLENEHKFSPTEFLAGMEAAQVQPDQSTYQGLIAAYCNEGDIEGASTILGFMKSNNLPITEEVFNSLITGHARSGDLESARNILSVMQGAGLVPGRGTYMALLCAYAEKGDIESMKQTLDSSERNLTDREFLKVIYALTKAGHSQLVPHVFELMQTCKGYFQELAVDLIKAIKEEGLPVRPHYSWPLLASFHSKNDLNESVGYFLYGLIDSVSDLEVQAREEHLKQYFHQLKEMDLDKALEIKSKYGDAFNFGTYMKVLGLCCVKNNPQEALKIREEIKQKGFSDVPTTVKYIDLLKVLTANGLIEDAINVLKEMQERDVAVNDSTTRSYFYILNTLALKGDVDSVYRLHEHIVMLGLAKPTANICSPLVMVHIERQRNPSPGMSSRRNGKRIPERLRSSRSPESRKTVLLRLCPFLYNKDHLEISTMLLCSSVGGRKDFPAALDAMIKCHEKYKCSPLEHDLLLKLVESGETDLLKKAVDHLSYAIGERLMLHDLLFAFVECEKYAEAQKIAETPGLRANPRKMNWFIERCKRSNKVEMLEKCVEITRVLFDSDREEMYFQLLKLYDRNNEWRKAKPLWDKMAEEGVTLKERTVQLFTDIFRNNGEDVNAHIPEISQEGVRSTRGDYSKRVVDLCENRNFNEAYSLFLEAEQNNVPLTKTAYTRIIKGLLEAGLLEDAFKVEDAAKTHFSNYTMKNVSCNLLLAEQVRRDCLKDALVTVERMLGNGRMPSRITLNRLTEAFAMEGDVESLEKMEKITESSSLSLPKMDRQFFNTKLLAYFRNGNTEEATSIIESHYTASEESHPISYLLSKLVKNNMSEALEKVSIVAERLANQFSVYRPVTELFLLYVQAGKEEEARHLLQRSNAILEQRGLLRVHIARQIFRDQEEYVFRLLDLLSDPFYRQAAYGSLMKRFAFTQKVEAASALYERMKSEQIELDVGSLKLLAALLRKAGKPVPFSEPQETVQSPSEEHNNESSPSEDKH